MSNKEEFPNLEAAARKLSGEERDFTREELRQLLCHDCAFWHEDHEEELECSCFQILKIMLARGVLSPESLAAAVRPRPDKG